MGYAVVEYIKQNQGDLIKDFVFIFISYFFSVLLTPKPNQALYQTNLPPSNREIINRVEEVRTKKIIIIREPKNQGKKQSSSDNSVFGLYIILGLLASYLFVRFHEIIMNSLLVLILMGLTATITVTYRLTVTGLLDPLSKWWLFLSFIVWIVAGYMFIELSSTKFSNINTSSIGDYLNSVGIEGAGKYLYQGMGTLMICLPILISYSILIHLYAISCFRARQGKISSYLIRITKSFVTSPKTTTIAIVLLCGVSFVFASGVAYNLIVASNPFKIFVGN
jgi:hypothetical protein